jgi:hypothetical protein
MRNKHEQGHTIRIERLKQLGRAGNEKERNVG